MDPRIIRWTSSDLDEDAHAGAFLGGLDDRLLLAGGHGRETLGTARVGVGLVAILDVGEAVVEHHEDVGGDLLAETVAGAEILIDPDLHGFLAYFRRWRHFGGHVRTIRMIAGPRPAAGSGPFGEPVFGHTESVGRTPERPTSRSGGHRIA